MTLTILVPIIFGHLTNILYFSNSKKVKFLEAVKNGFQKAISTILDANITTLISAIILFFLGSGPVKGFAVTLGIGILTTLFSVYFFARHLSSFYVMKNKDKKINI